MGGNTQEADTRVAYQPAERGGHLYFVMTFSVSDYYDWHEGKSVSIGGIPVSDRTLGRLHAVGLAQEFEMYGETVIRFDMPYDGRVPRFPSRELEHPFVEPFDGRTDIGREHR